jgi:protein involved in polysaccharide export with SLBB domain
MSILIRTLTVILFFIAFASNAVAEASTYKISTDDTIQIIVTDEPELHLDAVRIGASGLISMPLIGQVQVSGLTLAEIEALIVEKYLDGYLKKPRISARILEYRPFYITGEVRRPGSYPYREGLTIEKAVTLAGGFTNRASLNNIELVSEKDKSVVVEAELKDSVSPGDIITVNESFF